MEYSFGQLGSADPAVPFNFLSTPSLISGLAEWEEEKASTLCKHCSAIAKTLVCYLYHFSHSVLTQHHTDHHEKGDFLPSQRGKMFS